MKLTIVLIIIAIPFSGGFSIHHSTSTNRHFLSLLFSSSIPDFTSLLATSESIGSYISAVEAANEYLNSEVSLNSKAVTTCIKIFGQAALIDDALQILSIAKQKGVQLNVYHYNACIHACFRHKRYQEGLQCFDEMRANSVVPDSFTYSSIFAIFGVLKDSFAIQQTLESAALTTKDIVFYSSAIFAYEKCNDATACESILMTMIENKLNITEAIYAALMRVYRHTDVFKSIDYFHKIEASGMSLSRSTLLNFIDVLKSQPQYTNTLQEYKTKYAHILQKDPSGDAAPSTWRSSQVGPSIGSSVSRGSVSFNEVIAEARVSGNFTSAVHLADHWLATQKRLTPGGVTSCITIYGLARLPLKAVTVLDAMKIRGQAPNVKHYNAILVCLLRNNKLDEIDRVVASMSAAQVDKDSFTYGILLSLYDKRSDWEAAVAMFESLPSLSISRTTVHYNTLIGLLGKARRHEQALDVYDRLCTEGTPDRISHFTVISALENGGDFAKAAEIKQKALGISDTAIPKKISKAGTLQQKLLEQEGGGLVNVLFAMSGEIQKCVQVLQESEDNGITPHVSHYLRVIALCGETGDWSQALEIYQRMKARGIPLDTKAQKLLMHILKAYGDPEVVERVEQEIQGSVTP